MVSTVDAMQRIFAGLLALLMVLGAASPGRAGSSAPAAPADPPAPAASEAAPESAEDAQEPTPPRISYLHGEVSFWRPGAADWAPAALNMPLAPGDVLYAGPAGNVEIQVGPRAFARAAYGAQVGLDNQEPDFIQLRVTSGYAALDLRELAPGHTVELDTPGAAFTVEHAGYYHVEVRPDTTAFRTYRGGAAVMTPSGGSATPVAANQQAVITGGEARLEITAAPALTAWDRWNYQRSDYLAQPASARQLPAGVYGAEALDQYGTWRTVESYGSVWVPAGVAPGWSPYTTGRWIWDPRFGWTWLDDAPWGWAPFHHGRWVFVGSYWAWAPGPIIVRPVYSPALVVFLGGPIVVGRPLYWAPLGWGEPVIRWWGRPRHVGVAWWGGWGGPRVVNNVVISRTTAVNVTNINVYRNVNVTNAVVGVPADRFGRGAVRPVRLADQNQVRQLTPVRGALDVRPDAASVTGRAGAATTRPPDAVRARPVVATRAPHDAAPVLREQGLPAGSATAPQPQQRIVPAPARGTPPAARSTTAPGAATPAPGPARGPAAPGRATPDDGPRERPRGADRGPRQTTPSEPAGRVPAPARPSVTPAPGAPAAPAPQSAPPAPAARRAPPSPPAPTIQNAPAPRVREQSHGGRPSAPAERTPRGEPQGKSAPERGGQERGPRGDR
jgi:hypothetical protein